VLEAPSVDLPKLFLNLKDELFALAESTSGWPNRLASGRLSPFGPIHHLPF